MLSNLKREPGQKITWGLFFLKELFYVSSTTFAV